MVVTSTISSITPISLSIHSHAFGHLFHLLLRKEPKITQQLLIAPLFLSILPYSCSLLFHLHVIFAKNFNTTQMSLITHAHPNDDLYNYPLPTRIVHIGKYHPGHQQPILGAL